MIHHKTTGFSALYNNLPPDIRKLADKTYKLLKQNPKHPSLHFKPITQPYWSVRVGAHFRAVAVEPNKNEFVWIWIGPHETYNKKF